MIIKLMLTLMKVSAGFSPYPKLQILEQNSCSCKFLSLKCKKKVNLSVIIDDLSKQFSHFNILS